MGGDQEDGVGTAVTAIFVGGIGESRQAGAKPHLAAQAHARRHVTEMRDSSGLLIFASGIHAAEQHGRILAAEGLCISGADDLPVRVADALARVAQLGVLAEDSSLMLLVEDVLPLRDHARSLAIRSVVDVEGLVLRADRDRFLAARPAPAQVGVESEGVELRLRVVELYGRRRSADERPFRRDLMYEVHTSGKLGKVIAPLS